MSKPEQKHYVSVRFLADRYGVDRSTVWRWVTAGRFPKPVKLTDQMTRWVLAEVEEHDQKGSMDVEANKRRSLNARKASATVIGATVKFKTIWPLCCDVESASESYSSNKSARNLDRLVAACEALSRAVTKLSTRQSC